MLYLKEFSREKLLNQEKESREKEIIGPTEPLSVSAISIDVAGSIANVNYWGTGGHYILHCLKPEEDPKGALSNVHELMLLEKKKCPQFSGSCEAAVGAILVQENNNRVVCGEFQGFTTYIPTGEPRFTKVTIDNGRVRGYLCNAYLGQLTTTAEEISTEDPFIVGDEVHRAGHTVGYWYIHPLPFGNKAELLELRSDSAETKLFRVIAVQYFEEEKVWGIYLDGLNSWYPAMCFRKKGQGFFDVEYNPYPEDKK